MILQKQRFILLSKPASAMKHLYLYGVTDGARTHDNRNHNQIVKYIISKG